MAASQQKLVHKGQRVGQRRTEGTYVATYYLHLPPQLIIHSPTHGKAMHMSHFHSHSDGIAILLLKHKPIRTTPFSILNQLINN